MIWGARQAGCPGDSGNEQAGSAADTCVKKDDLLPTILESWLRCFRSLPSFELGDLGPLAFGGKWKQAADARAAGGVGGCAYF